MVGEICAEIKNYFVYENDRHIGDWVILNGQISPALEIPTDYIRIVGSHLNDGVHKISEMQLVDEEFHGAICIMSPPSVFLLLCEEIAQWQDKNGSADSVNMSPFQSESFGGYSYSKGQNFSGDKAKSAVPTWQSVFGNRLNQFRRIREL